MVNGRSMHLALQSRLKDYIEHFNGRQTKCNFQISTSLDLDKTLIPKWTYTSNATIGSDPASDSLGFVRKGAQ